jgi:hypothetical protein
VFKDRLDEVGQILRAPPQSTPHRPEVGRVDRGARWRVARVATAVAGFRGSHGR